MAYGRSGPLHVYTTWLTCFTHVNGCRGSALHMDVAADHCHLWSYCTVSPIGPLTPGDVHVDRYAVILLGTIRNKLSANRPLCVLCILHAVPRQKIQFEKSSDGLSCSLYWVR